MANMRTQEPELFEAFETAAPCSSVRKRDKINTDESKVEWRTQLPKRKECQAGKIKPMRSRLLKVV